MGVQFPALKTMVTVFVLIMGNTSPVEPVITAAISASTVAGIAAQVVSAGATLAGTTLQGLAAAGFSVTCVIEVENWTRYALKYPTVRISGDGAVTTSLSAILPAKKEAFAVRKPSHTATGVAGTVSWQMANASRLMVVMWSAPYSFDLHSNWMGVGMTRKGLTTVAQGDIWFDQMYNGNSTDDLSFERGEFYSELDPVIYRNSQFEIVGTMTNIHKAQVKVVIRPTRNNWKDLAAPIRGLLEQGVRRSSSE